jgi:hypothetical protein
MVAATHRRIQMADLSGYKRFATTLDGDLTPRHSVGQAVDYYLDRMRISRQNLDWMAFSRGVRLDSKMPVGDLTDEDLEEVTVMPEVQAG